MDEVEDPDKEISLEEAKKIKPSYKVGDTISEEVTPKNFGRIAAQTAKQVIMQRLREAERENLSAEMNSKNDQLTTAIVRRKDNENVYVELSGMEKEGVLNQRDIIPGENLEIGQHIKVLFKRVHDNIFGNAEIQVTRTTPSFVRKLFELEVPEIQSGDVVIKGIARDAGIRTKISVASTNPNVDPVGSIVGAHGARINAVQSEIGNKERIDVVLYDDDIFEYIANALSPAEVISVEINQEAKTSKVIVPDNKLSLAIGKDGGNVRLAAKLTGWRIDVKSESSNAKEEQSKQVQEFTSRFDSDNPDSDIDIFEDIQGV